MCRAPASSSPASDPHTHLHIDSLRDESDVLLSRRRPPPMRTDSAMTARYVGSSPVCRSQRTSPMGSAALA